MRELEILETHVVSGGLPNRPLPASCSARSMLTAAGYGALAGIPGFAGGPAIGFSGMLFGASLGGIGQLHACVNDLRQYRR